MEPVTPALLVRSKSLGAEGGGKECSLLLTITHNHTITHTHTHTHTPWTCQELRPKSINKRFHRNLVVLVFLTLLCLPTSVQLVGYANKSSALKSPDKGIYLSARPECPICSCKFAPPCSCALWFRATDAGSPGWSGAGTNLPTPSKPQVRLWTRILLRLWSAELLWPHPAGRRSGGAAGAGVALAFPWHAAAGSSRILSVQPWCQPAEDSARGHPDVAHFPARRCFCVLKEDASSSVFLFCFVFLPFAFKTFILGAIFFKLKYR